MNKRHNDFYPMVRPKPTSMLWCPPSNKSCNQLLSSDHLGQLLNLSATIFFFISSIPVCEESPQLGVSHSLTK
jgi:hypothetical protein